MPGLALLYVGAVLFLNGLWLTGRIQDKESAVINVFAGGVTLLVALSWILGPGADAETIRAAGFLLLFTFTSLWIAIDRYIGADGQGLGWFSLFVAITLIPVAYSAPSEATTLATIWLLALGRPIPRITGIVTSVAGVVMAWIPGYPLLTGQLTAP